MRKLRLSKQLIVLTTPEEHKFVKDLSDVQEVSMGELIRKLIADEMKKANELATQK